MAYLMAYLKKKGNTTCITAATKHTQDASHQGLFSMAIQQIKLKSITLQQDQRLAVMNVITIVSYVDRIWINTKHIKIPNIQSIEMVHFVLLIKKQGVVQ
jgi:hypothetical protein